MNHGKKFNHLKRKPSHRKALLKNLAKSLIIHKRIKTTLAKAKELRRFIEPLITKSKTNTTHSRRIVFSYFQDKEPVKILFDQISLKIQSRPGGYTRIIKLTERRKGDNSEMCYIELVDYNELMTKSTSITTTKRTRRSRSKSHTPLIPQKQNNEQQNSTKETSSSSKKEQNIKKVDTSDINLNQSLSNLQEQNKDKNSLNDKSEKQSNENNQKKAKLKVNKKNKIY